MDYKKDFNYSPEISISASQIGISKWNWIYHDFNKTEEEALSIMKNNRFDVLPILESDGTYKNYYCTQEWNNYNNLNKLKIRDTSTIYYRLSFRDLIKKFKNDDKYYYFLTNYEEILGLVSYVNLNCQLVYNYLFYIISDIEKSISQILQENIPLNILIEEFSKSTDKHIVELLENYCKSKNENSDTNIFQQMYLQTLGITIHKFHNTLPDNFKKLNKFSKKFNSNGLYTEIRNKIMHPVRPILSNHESINKIDELLNDYDEIKQIIESI